MWGISTGLRPLPLTIGAMALLVVVKLAALAQGPGAPAVLASAGRAVIPAAQASSSEEAKPAGHAGAKPPGAEAAAPAHPLTAGAPVVPPSVPAAPAIPAPSEAEMALLQDLRSRRATLDGRAQTLETREAVLAAAERRVSERVEQLAAMQTRLEAIDQTRRERDEANWRGLVKTYETMRPRDAAAIFNELDQPVLMQVLDRMKEAKMAPVLAAMLPERARAATTELAQWRNRGGVQP